MKTRPRIATAGVAILLSMAGMAAAVAEPKDGGDWDHGSSGGRVWSNYWHPSVNHGASVQGLRYVDSGCQPAGTWARAQAPSNPIWSDGSYYRFC
ncbi:lactococcin 972 family bacteriocin [Corynebacterium liangguodongii]|uniref:Lactococcin 972 family bacteriocin n=1 Tax=Corynebacterium liangguodongii TaxID=2079535 RepID=A0A2S0WCG9_9CORY|nr:lactococcin 972 family bacteriocin [Corynebacterium liangguodongii]PWC00448.1 lactococcin 972 family bacteriocin [Corynebacterium liangguodongii]